MSKRLLGLLLLVLSLGWTHVAHAALTSSSDPVTPGGSGGVTVMLSASASATIATDDPLGETLDHFGFVGASCPQFAVDAGPLPATVTLVTALPVSVTFTPTSRGNVGCTVEMRSAGNALLGSFQVAGKGVAQAITTTPTVMSGFGSVRVSNATVTTVARTIAINNAGDAGHDLVVSALAISGAHAADYEITTAPSLPATIAPGAHVDVIVTFDPSSPGTRTASLDITSDDPVTAASSVALTGIGTTAKITVTDLAFGVVQDGTTLSNNIVVSNAGAAPQGALRVTSAAIAPAAMSWFSFEANNGACLGATSCGFGGGFNAPPSTDVGVRCRPPVGATGVQVATVTFVSDSDAGGVTVANLTCTAGAPNIMLDTTSLAFGDQRVPTSSAAQTVTISNTGNAPLTYSIAKTGAAGLVALYTITAANGCTTGCTLAAGAMTTFTVLFTPSAPGAANIAINITSDDPGTPTTAIAVTGAGVAPQLVAPGALGYGTIDVGAVSPTQTLVVSNTGGADLTISNASISSGSSDYTALNGTIGAQSTTIAPGASVSWDLACDPQAQGSRPGTFRILSNSFTAATTNISLTCTGQQGVLATVPATSAATPLDFGAVTQGTSVRLTYALKNTGNVTVSGITGVLDTATAGYSLDPSTPIPTTLTAGQSVTLGILFAPTVTADGGPATVTFSGSWGASPTATLVVLHVSGDGLTAGFDVSPAAINFGDLRFDATANRTFCIANTSQSTVQILGSLSFALHGSTITGEFSIVGSPKLQATCGVGGANVTLPRTLDPGQVLEITVRAAPANRVGVLDAALTVTSNLAAPDTTRTVALLANSTSAVLQTSVAGVPTTTLDFGAVDLDAGPDTRTLTITNTGTAPLDLSSFSRTVGPSFTLSLPANQQVPPGGHLDIAVTYKPTVERAAGQQEQIILTHNVAGVLGGPAQQMILIRGRGVDRHLALGPAPVFPATFRDPGDAAPVRPIAVTNTGEATLHVSAVMVTNDEVWELLDPGPVDIAFNATHEFRVRFSPKVAGKAPVGVLTIQNNDNTTASSTMAIVQLEGDGLDRLVSMGDPVIDLGYTSVGVPVTMDKVLSITSLDPANGFQIRSIQLDDGNAFAIENAPTDVILAPSSSLHYAITFTPDAEGDYETKAHLFLDMDPHAQAEVTLKGHALFVDAHGGGGCASGRELGGGALVVLAALALALRRRRTSTAILVIAAALALAPAAARAEAGRNLDLALFNPTPSTVGENFQLQDANMGEKGSWVVSALVSYATNPLVLGLTAGDHLAITRRTMIGLGGAYVFLDRFELGARIPLYNQEGDIAMDGISPPTGTARGDLVIHGKARLWNGPIGASQLVFGASLHMTLPTATAAAFAGVEKPTSRLLGLATWTPDAMAHRLAITANAGFVLRSPSKFANIEQGSGVAWGVGASFRMSDALWATAEMFGDMIPGGRRARPATGQTMGAASTLTSIEYLAGITFHMDRRISLGFAAGRGLNSGLGTPDLRGVFSLSYAPGGELIPLHGSPVPALDRDSDGDGIRDRADKCPHEAEDHDLYEDDDGCPDLDNDMDGIPDADDRCPVEPEDKDGFQDDDGCPDRDNDGDGIPDVLDKCPMEPEDKDGFQDADGCPEPDNDNDGILDSADRCPNEPETINGNQDDDGCPDRGDSVVVLTPSGLEMLETIKFTGSKLSRQSFNVLGQIGATLRARTEILRLKIISHVQPSDAPDKDQELSDKRAEAVRDWLVQWGIPPGRIVAKGFGSTKPLVPRDQRGSAVLNDRIELVILERK